MDVFQAAARLRFFYMGAGHALMLHFADENDCLGGWESAEKYQSSD